MIHFILRRTAVSIPILLAVVTLIFLLVRAMPGGPAEAMLGDYASREAVEALEEQMGLNDPLWSQYARFLGDLLKGDLGTSLTTGAPIAPAVVRASASPSVFSRPCGATGRSITSVGRYRWSGYRSPHFSSVSC
jgi:ABC-type dipeptide/oligopeptide/nickel transport system permease component